MSATRDKSQKVAFVYTNLYELYKKEKAKNQNATPVESNGPSIVNVGKAKVVSEGIRPGLRIHSLSQAPQKQTLDKLRGNLNDLKDLHSRLRFMLNELENLLKKKS